MDLPRRIRNANRRFPTGVTVVTVNEDSHPLGLVVSTFSNVSFDPPLVMVCVQATSSTYPALFSNNSVAINVLAADQRKVVNAFASSGGDKFEGVRWRAGVTGAPIIESATAHFELQVNHRIPAYTHTIFIGEVIDAQISDRPPLVYLNAELYDSGSLTIASDG